MTTAQEQFREALDAFFSKGKAHQAELFPPPAIKVNRMADTTRTALEILAETDALARKFAVEMNHHVAPDEVMAASANTITRLCWRLACLAQDELTGTDIDDVIEEAKGE